MRCSGERRLRINPHEEAVDDLATDKARSGMANGTTRRIAQRHSLRGLAFCRAGRREFFSAALRIRDVDLPDRSGLLRGHDASGGLTLSGDSAGDNATNTSDA